MNNSQNFQVVKKKRGRRPTPLGDLDRKVAKELGDFILTLAKEYDLSPETACAKSKGVKWYQPHTLTTKDGLAKIGGTKRLGQSYIDRFISYRVGEAKLTLAAWLPRDPSATAVTYQIFAPEGDLEIPLAWSELRPRVTMPNGNPVGQEFQDFNAAETKMRQLIARYADKR
jgi:hypothetical protein